MKRHRDLIFGSNYLTIKTETKQYANGSLGRNMYEEGEEKIMKFGGGSVENFKYKQKLFLFFYNTEIDLRCSSYSFFSFFSPFFIIIFLRKFLN